MRPLGLLWLSQHFRLPAAAMPQRSYQGSRRKSVIKTDAPVEEYFPRSYWPTDDPLSHLEFALKYEPLNFDLLEQIFRQMPAPTIEAFLHKAPSSKHHRKIGFLYEFLTGRVLTTAVTGNYVPLVDPQKYFTGKALKVPRWRVIDNLLGGAGCCPLVRRTPEIESKLKRDWPKEIRKITQNADARLWARAVNYLYLKETKASFAIEREEVTPSRSERFVALLASSGRVTNETVLDEARLAELQGQIVDPRYAASGYRKEQNYVGQTLPGFQEKVHYICPPPSLVRTLMAGLRTFCLRGRELPAPVRAAVVSFGFVYVHPFLDGNGRLHRLLLHEMLAMDGYTEKEVVLPFSAAMLRDPQSYDRVLESFSKTVVARVRYHLDRVGSMTLENARDSEGVWRYPDLTAHVEYVLELIEATVTRDLPDELAMLGKLDRLASRIKAVVDMPSAKLNLMLALLGENNGRLSKRKRTSHFNELTEKEIAEIETAFSEVFRSESHA
jgi:hypothetical protein